MAARKPGPRSTAITNGSRSAGFLWRIPPVCSCAGSPSTRCRVPAPGSWSMSNRGCLRAWWAGDGAVRPGFRTGARPCYHRWHGRSGRWHLRNCSAKNERTASDRPDLRCPPHSRLRFSGSRRGRCPKRRGFPGGTRSWPNPAADLGGLQFELEGLLGRSVDVVTERGLKARIRERVLREAVPV